MPESAWTNFGSVTTNGGRTGLVPETGGDPLVPIEVYTGGMAIQIPKWQGWAKGAKEKLNQMLAGEAA